MKSWLRLKPNKLDRKAEDVDRIPNNVGSKAEEVLVGKKSSYQLSASDGHLDKKSLLKYPSMYKSRGMVYEEDHPSPHPGSKVRIIIAV